MKRFCGVHQHQLVLLLAAAVATALDTSHNLASERSSIESTYELTKYLEYQLKQIKDVYLTYLGPPFNEKDFSPPRPNSTALSLPSAATRLELWHGLENQARLAQNQRAYSVLLAAVRELARSTLCPSLKTSLLHFCTGLDGLLGSISALMTTLGYALPPQSANMGSNGGDLQYPQRAGGDRPAPLMSQSLYRSRAGTRTESGHRNNQKRSGMRVVRGEREDGVNVEVMERRRGKEGRRAEVIAAGGRSGGSKETGRGERGRRGKREEPESGKWFTNEEEGARAEEEEEEELEQDGGTERWGRRRLLSISDGGETEWQQPEPGVKVSYPGTESSKYLRQITIQNNNNNNNNNNNQYSYNLNSHPDTFRKEDGFIVETNAGLTMDGEKQTDMEAAPSSSTFYHHQRRPPRSLYLPTLQPSLSTLSFLYQFGAGEKHTLLPQPVPLSLRRGTALLSPPLTPLLSTSTSSSTSSSSSSSASSSLLSVRPTMNDFARKVEGFWILRELQSWLWRSAKDFNRLKKRLRG